MNFHIIYSMRNKQKCTQCEIKTTDQGLITKQSHQHILNHVSRCTNACFVHSLSVAFLKWTLTGWFAHTGPLNLNSTPIRSAKWKICSSNPVALNLATTYKTGKGWVSADRCFISVTIVWLQCLPLWSTASTQPMKLTFVLTVAARERWGSQGIVLRFAIYHKGQRGSEISWGH